MDEVKDILSAMGCVWNGPFETIEPLMLSLTVEEAPLGKSSEKGTFKLVYEFLFKDFDESLNPLIETFLQHLERILDVWISEGVVEVRMVKQ